ncbi:hypothetical protein ZIOFF_012002 [Zingiber officinale]|uniref:Uncharacterized protein n=1 Tax=Zingiber officinale TaxID=94328 RepID=A0A8J5LTM0_ZINOF|nr:hypothetical protein ZIOFF_012002 [Zingiber officinale]
MESLPFVLPRLGQSGTLTLTGPSFGRGVVRFVSFAPVKASSGAEVTSVSCSAIAPAPDARPGLCRTPPLALLGGIDDVEEKIEKAKDLSHLLAGSLMGSIICFLKIEAAWILQLKLGLNVIGYFHFDWNYPLKLIGLESPYCRVKSSLISMSPWILPIDICHFRIAELIDIVPINLPIGFVDPN